MGTTTDRNRTDRVERIRDRVDELVTPATTTDTERVWDAERSRWVLRTHTVEHPPLLVQVEASVAGRSGAATTAHVTTSAHAQGSRPTARLAAIDTALAIRDDAARLLVRLLRASPASTTENLRRLASRAHELDPEGLAQLDAAVLRWWARARAISGWEAPPWRPHVRCMVCD
ncbi:MAG TPA: hypothetical protein PKB06_11010, partial [Actinotalea sp.]|nr:hypothetical protein [Actinotalea sp.]